MKRSNVLLAAITSVLAILVEPVAAHPPAELESFIGAKGGQAEMGLQNLGYESAQVRGLTAFWWNAGEGVCVKIVTANGRYKTIDVVKPSQCGRRVNAGTATGPGAGCPSDVSEANRYLYPDCDKPSGANSGDVPEVALDACRRSADEFQGVTPGTSSVNGARKVGSNWVLKMASGSTYKSTCTVSSRGRVISMEPGY